MGREKYYSGRSFTRPADEESYCTCAAGCFMTGVLHLFDPHHRHRHQIQYHPPPPQSRRQPAEAFQAQPLRGTGAPRNTLELDYDPAVFRRRDESEKHASLETSRLIVGSKTPNLVARLMGLDLLPLPADAAESSPRSLINRSDGSLPTNGRTKTTPVTQDMGIRSMPSSPRVSSSRRSDVGPRISFQLNKEISSDDVPDLENGYKISSPSSLIRSRKLKKDGSGGTSKIQHENRSPSSHAKEIAKNMKERAIRRVGLLDISNTSRDNRTCQLIESNSATIIGEMRKMKKNAGGSANLKSKSKRTVKKDCRKKSFMSFDSLNLNANLCPDSSSPLLTDSTCNRTSAAQPAIKNSLRSAKSKSLPKSIAKCKKASCERFTQRRVSPYPSRISTPAGERCKLALSNHLLQIHPTAEFTRRSRPTVGGSVSPRGQSHQQQHKQHREEPNLQEVEWLFGFELSGAGGGRGWEAPTEGESLVLELERKIVDSLVDECLVLLS